MNNSIKAISPGIIQICRHDNLSESFLEKYGIISIPNTVHSEPTLSVSDGKIVLPNGKTLEFDIRPEEDDDFWSDEVSYQLNKFRDKTPDRINIEGRPDECAESWNSDICGKDSEMRFGISFRISESELFYGLGEANRNGIQHRGMSFQNWVVYQFNEICIPFIMSCENWGILICAQGRHFVDVDDHTKGRLTVVGNSDNLNILLFYGSSMKDIIKLYTDISGKSMLLPKWAYGLTYIAPLHQNQFEILNDMMKFREKHIPCDNVSLEPGWMKNFYDYSFDKDWNLEKFHIEKWMRSRSSNKSFLSVMRRFGFHVALWLCMNYDLCDHEEGLAGGESSLPRWYDHLMKFVDSGVDGFKIDPADMTMRVDPRKIYTNGKSELEMHNLSQTLVMKQMNEGFSEQTNMRPFIHYCGGYIGQQRWGAATTGDNGGLCGSMIWLENLAMSGFMNSTVDMDIYHAEAIHFAFFAPWAHQNAWSGCGQPWYAGAECEQIYTYYARLRYSLIPYIYSAAIECHETGIPMIRPMPLEFQDDRNCADCANQYMFGEYLMVSAFTNRIYLPNGIWVDFWTGKEYEGPFLINSYIPPKGRGGGLFVKKGAIIPKWHDRDYISQYSEEEIELHIYPCRETKYIFREDDGISLDYLNHTSCHTEIVCREMNGKVEIHIGNRCGEYRKKPEMRIWNVTVHGTDKPVTIDCDEHSASVRIIPETSA